MRQENEERGRCWRPAGHGPRRLHEAYSLKTHQDPIITKASTCTPKFNHEKKRKAWEVSGDAREVNW